jgi:hypothetical protein
MRVKRFLLLALLFLLSCAHTPQPILPVHIKKISIPIFKNNTLQYGLQDMLTNYTIEEFILDGQLEIVSRKEADGELRGKIISFSEEPMLYDDVGNVTEYRIWMLVELSFYDLKEGRLLWKDEREEYFTYEDFPLARDDALEEMMRNLATKIVNRTIEGFW